MNHPAKTPATTTSLRALLALGAVALSCGSGPDPSQGGAVVVVESTPSTFTGGTSGSYGFNQGVALGSEGTYVGNSGSLVRVRFDGSGTSIGSTFSTVGTLSIAVAASDGSVWWAGVPQSLACTGVNPGGQALGLWTSSESDVVTVPVSALPVSRLCTISSGMSGGVLGVYGLAADARWVFLAVADSSGMTGPTFFPDQQDWPSSASPMLTPSGSAALMRFDRQNPSAPMTGLSGVSQLATALTLHVLAQNAQQVYWLDGGLGGSDRVMRAAKDPWTSGQVLATLPAFSVTGIAASDAYTVWTASGPPVTGQAGCAVYASHSDGPPVKIYDGSSAPFLCWGAGLDETYAYFTTAVVVSPSGGSGGNGSNGGSSPYLHGTGIARVPLAGGALQTVPLTSDRWYGPRRVKVDAQYVYAIDPSFIARVDKTAFGG